LSSLLEAENAGADETALEDPDLPVHELRTEPAFEPEPEPDEVPPRESAFDPEPEPDLDLDLNDIPMDSEPERLRRGPPAEDEGPEPDLDDILARLGEQERDRTRRGDGIDRESLDNGFDLDHDDDSDPLPGILRTQLKEQRRRAKMPSWASAAVAVVLVLAALGGGAYLGRDSIVEAWPPAEDWYSALGIPLTRPGLGLTLQNVVPTRELVNGNDILVVRGFVANTSDKMRRVPSLRLEMRDADKTLIQHMSMGPPVQTLMPGQRVNFVMTMENPLADAETFEVLFTEPDPAPVMTPASPALSSPVPSSPTPARPTAGGGHDESHGADAATNHAPAQAPTH